MKTLQRKMLVYIILIGVLPMLLIGIICYNTASDKADEMLNEESYNILSRLDSIISVKTSNLQNTADILFSDAEFQRLLRETDLEEQDSNQLAKIDLSLQKMFRVEPELETILLLSKGGEVYVSGKPLAETNYTRFMMDYGRITGNAGTISWRGVSESANPSKGEKKIVAGTIIRDNVYLMDQEYLASMYMVFSGDLFEDSEGFAEPKEPTEATESEHTKDEQTDELIYVYRGGGTELIYSLGAERVGNLTSKLTVNEAKEIFGKNRGRVELMLHNTHYAVVFDTAEATGYKYIRTVPASRYDSNYQYIAYATILCILMLFILWCIINYLVVRRITLPLREIVQAMKKVEDENLEVTLPVHSKDEFGLISRQFNKMLGTIKNLLARVRNEEHKRKESDILMLQYQMNPHFLYNTIAAIRMEAMMNKQHNIDKMLLILGRFLRNTIVRGTNLTTIKEEMSNLEDYISLMQLRYRNQLDTTIDIDKETEKMKIPGMLIQPIIENSIMHGLNDRFDRDESAILKIRAEKTENNVFITVYDNGKGMSDEEMAKVRSGFSKEATDSEMRGRHIGLRNIHRRVTMMFGEAFGVDIRSRQGEYTEVSIKLPIIRD